MKLYLSSYLVPVVDELAKLIGKPLNDARIALIPNAKDYYGKRAWEFKVDSYIAYFVGLGAHVDVVDLRSLLSAAATKEKLLDYDLIWAAGGNTFCLRYQMRRSGFDVVIRELLAGGIVYGGDSAGALVAGRQIGGLGIEKVDTPEFAEEVIQEGLGLIPNIILPHADDPEFADVTESVRNDYQGVIELKNSEAVVFDETGQHLVAALLP